MAVSLKHAFTSNVADSGDATLVQPSNWNAEHNLTAAANTLLGAVTAGSVTEISCTAAGRTILAAADAAAQRTALGLGTGDSPTFTGLTLTGVGGFSAGSAALPSIVSSADTATGAWFPATSTMAFSTAGVERMRINSVGNVGIGTTSLSAANLHVYKAFTGGTSTYGIISGGNVASDVTGSATGFFTNITVNNSTFTTSVNHYSAFFNALGANATMTAQRGFLASPFTQATNNYGFIALDASAIGAGKTNYAFFSGNNTATGGGTTWAFYGAGTAFSYFGGAVGIGTTGLSTTSLYVAKNITGGTAAVGVFSGANVLSDVTSGAYAFRSSIGTQAAAFTLAALYHFSAEQNALGAGSALTNQYGFISGSANIDATNNYAFSAANTAAVTTGKTAYGYHSVINVATGGGTTWAFYSAGTAWNYFAGPVIFDDEIWLDAPAPTAKSTTATLTAAEIKTGIISTTGTSYTLTLPTGTDIDTGFSGIPSTVNIGFDLSIVNTASGTITIAVNTGVTSLGDLTITTNNSALFRLRRTAANTYVIYRLA